MHSKECLQHPAGTGSTPAIDVRLASERDISINGYDFLTPVRKFIIPVVIDRDYDGNASRFQHVSKRFLITHFGHAPEGNLSDELRSELTRLIRERRSQRPS